jgi:Protein of unknown function (DUF998)
VVKRHLRSALAAGFVAPVFFAIVLVVLTIHQREFLDAAGWSPVRRTAVEWPSLLMLGPGGWAMIAALAVCGALGLVFAAAFHKIAPTARLRGGAGLLAVMSAAILLESFRPDPVTAVAASWHDAIHRNAYPVIPISALAAAAVFGSERGRNAWRLVRRSSLLGLAVMAPAFGLSEIDAIAQLARYLLLGALLAWIAVVAVTVYRTATEEGIDERFVA